MKLRGKFQAPAIVVGLALLASMFSAVAFPQTAQAAGCKLHVNVDRDFRHAKEIWGNVQYVCPVVQMEIKMNGKLNVWRNGGWRTLKRGYKECSYARSCYIGLGRVNDRSGKQEWGVRGYVNTGGFGKVKWDTAVY